MNFELTEEHLNVQQAARDFAQNELLPGVINAMNWENSHWNIFASLASLVLWE